MKDMTIFNTEYLSAVGPAPSTACYGYIFPTPRKETLA